MRTVLLACLLIACGGKTSSAPPMVPPAPTASPTSQFGAGPPLVTPGERMVYRVEIRGVELAAMTLAVGDRTEYDGQPVIVVQGHAKSVGFADMIAAIDNTFTSWIDVRTGRSLRFVVDEYATNSATSIEHTIADLAGREGNTLPITFALNDAAPVPEPQTLSLPDVWDYNAFLVALRSWEGELGSKSSVEVLRSRWLWHIDLEIRTKETLPTELGALPALRFDASTYRLDRKGQRDTTSEARVFSIWISDDDGRVPLKIRAVTDYGEVTMDIVDYQPGTGQRITR